MTVKWGSCDVTTYPIFCRYYVSLSGCRQKDLLERRFHNLNVREYFTLNICDKHYCAHDMLKSSELSLFQIKGFLNKRVNEYDR